MKFLCPFKPVAVPVFLPKISAVIVAITATDLLERAPFCFPTGNDRAEPLLLGSRSVQLPRFDGAVLS